MTDDALAWRAWPLRRRPFLGAGAALVAVGTVWGVWSWTTSAMMCVLAAAVLAACVGPFFFPTRYRLTPEGIEVVRLFMARRRPWSEFRGVQRSREALILSSARRHAWLPGREETLFLEGNGDEVRAYVEEMVGAAPGGRGP
jgi:hypothetical protein